MERHEKQRNRRNQYPNAETARHTAADITGDDNMRRHRRHQQLFNIALKLGAEERRGDVSVGVGDHCHHNQARHDKLHIAEAVHIADARTDQVAENNKIERHGDHRRHQRLDPDAGKTVDLLGPDTLQRHPVQMCHAFTPLPCTRLTNSSSRRFALLRMLSTCTPCALSWPKTLFRPCSRITSTSSVEASTRRY